MSLGGTIRCVRAYYLCRRCGHGHCPFDREVGLPDGRLTPAAERLATLTGAIADSFAKGSELLEETAGIRLSEATVQRTTEAAGRRLARLLGQGHTLGPAQPWEWYRDADNRRVAYVSIDATGVRQQGPHGERADGRMAYVGMIFNPLPDKQRVFEGLPRPGAAMQARYISGLYALAEMGPLLRRQGAQVGMDGADIWVGLTDGGNGLEAFVDSNFPRVGVVILDFYHAADYLTRLAQVLHGKDDGRAQAQAQQWRSLLKAEGGHALISVLDQWDWPTGVPGLKKMREEVLQYFRNQRERMDYPAYEAAGWYIGSGAVESACKTVVGQRLKGAGMRWGEAGSHEVCHVRALYRSEEGQWQAFWQRKIIAQCKNPPPN